MIKTGKYSIEEDDYIINNFRLMTVKQIADNLNRKDKSVQDRMRKLHLIKVNKDKWSIDEINKLTLYYNKTPEVFNMFPNRTRSSIQYKAHALGLKKYNRGNFSVDYNFFKTWTEDMAYMLGFIVADGNISTDPKILNITQSKKDLYILEQFNKLLKCKRPIVIQKNNICHLVIRNGELVDDLIKLGVEPRKSLTMRWFSGIPDEYLRHFVRGYLDGDGCICTYNRKNRGQIIEVSFLGTRDFLEGMSVNISKQINIPIIKVFDVKNTKIKRMKYSYSSALKLLDWLYKDCNLYLLRKYDKYINYLKQDNNSNT